MTHNQFKRDCGACRCHILSGDALLKAIKGQFKAKAISAVDAVTRLRGAGISEPEIKEALSAGLADHLA